MNNKDMVDSSFTNWIRDEMIKRGWRQADVVRMTGITRGGLSLILNGQVRPAPQTLSQLAKAFGVSPDFLMRKVGYLPRQEDFDPMLKEANYKLSLLDQAKKQQVLDFMDFLIGRNQRNGIAKSNGNGEDDTSGKVE